MKYLITLLIVFCTFLLYAQEKGISPITSDPKASSAQTYAVVVGISDYQDEGIPDLRISNSNFHSE